MLNINNYQYNKTWNFLIITYQSSPNGHHQEQKKSQQMLMCMWENEIRYTLLIVVYIIIQIMLIILVVTQTVETNLPDDPLLLLIGITQLTVFLMTREAYNTYSLML